MAREMQLFCISTKVTQLTYRVHDECGLVSLMKGIARMRLFCNGEHETKGRATEKKRKGDHGANLPETKHWAFVNGMLSLAPLPGRRISPWPMYSTEHRG